MTKRLKTLIGIGLVVLLTTVFHWLGWLNGVERFFVRLINPLTSVSYSLSVSGPDSEEKITTVEQLEQAYRDLKEKYLVAQIDRANLELVENENKELRAQLNFLADKNFTHLGARVIGKNVDLFGSSLLIDRGSQDGVEIGDPAIVSGGVLVGTVNQVFQNSATVRLINDNLSKVASTINNKEKSIGLVEGGFGISVQMNFIPQNETVAVDDQVITSGLTEKIPRGLLIGTINTVEREAYQPFQRAIITPAVNLDKISVLSILID